MTGAMDKHLILSAAHSLNRVMDIVLGTRESYMCVRAYALCVGEWYVMLACDALRSGVLL